MKLVECPGGISIILSNTEYKVYDKIVKETCKSDFTEREAFVAKSLVSKGVLTRVVREGKVYFERLRGSL
jgi:hypothetical protein|tara:strand:+ start:189 stop:398 length:210 start_codon:yes stop_codon:yes gene_type:complete